MTTSELIRPNLKALIAMAVSRLELVSEAVAAEDQPLTPKIAKNAREAKALVALIIQSVNDLREAAKTTTVKKGK